MFRLAGLVLSLLIFAGISSGPAAAAPVVITFETLPGPDGVLGTSDDVPTENTPSTWIRDEYASVGLIFTQATLFQGSFFDGNPNNHFLSSAYPIGFFSVPVFNMSISSKWPSLATLTAYDAADNIIGSVTESSIWSVPPSITTIELITTQAIHHFTVMRNGDPDQILNLDNLAFNVATTDVPEPSQLAMLGLGLLAMMHRYPRGKRS